MIVYLMKKLLPATAILKDKDDFLEKANENGIYDNLFAR